MASEEDVWKAQMHAHKKPHFGPVDFEIPIYNQERAVVEQMTACSLIGSPESPWIFNSSNCVNGYLFDEIMAVSYIF